ncbi:MAG: Asp-tRNA(Asn)/Glu-tRNA(Gln) amidotransferase subunit GatB, partial [Candidatus Saccharimonadales bacterium]
SVEAAVAYEIKRQTELLKKGGKVVQETRGWDEAKQKTFAQRTKEEAEDYRYMPEPDVPPVELGETYLESIKKSLPELPGEIRTKLRKLDISPQVIEDILDRAPIIKPVLDVLKAAGPTDARRAAFWLIQTEPPDEQMAGAVEPEIDSERLIALSEMVDAGELSSTAAKSVFEQLVITTDDPRTIAEKLNLLQVSDTAKLEEIVSEVIAENPKVIEDIKAGQTKAIAFLVGQAMVKTQGQINPALAQEIIKKRLAAK